MLLEEKYLKRHKNILFYNFPVSAAGAYLL